jgi:hypothetical protein
MKEIAKELDQAVRMKENDRATAGRSSINAQLWTEKYAPIHMKEICGNKGLVEKLRKWLEEWFVLFVLYLSQATTSQGEFQETRPPWHGMLPCCHHFRPSGNWQDDIGTSSSEIRGL